VVEELVSFIFSSQHVISPFHLTNHDSPYHHSLVSNLHNLLNTCNLSPSTHLLLLLLLLHQSPPQLHHLIPPVLIRATNPITNMLPQSRIQSSQPTQALKLLSPNSRMLSRTILVLGKTQ
jgi:hypothetical protein